MNWKNGQPPEDFVGFAIEYQEPGGDQFFALNNRLASRLPTATSTRTRSRRCSRRSRSSAGCISHATPTSPATSPIASRPVFMNAADELSYGEPQEAADRARAAKPIRDANVAFTRGFVSSQAFVDRYDRTGRSRTLLPADAARADIRPDPPRRRPRRLPGWASRRAARSSSAGPGNRRQEGEVRVVAYDFNQPDVVDRLEQLGSASEIIIDDSTRDHGKPGLRGGPGRSTPGGFGRARDRTSCASTWASFSTTRPSRSTARR